jgi:hypothetical protein
MGHFQLLIDVCQNFGDAYNPQNPILLTTAMETKHATVQTSIDLVDTLIPPYLTALSVRQEKFAPLAGLSARVLATATVLGLPSAILTRAKEMVHKVRGERARKLTDSSKKKTAEGNEGIEGKEVKKVKEAKHISVSQTSFNERIEHFNQLIDLVSSQPAYTPAETELTVASLKTLLNEMRTSNNAAMAASVPLAAARQERDILLFAPGTGMIDTALLAKEYVKAVFGTNSPQYKAVRHITFKNR